MVGGMPVYMYGELQFVDLQVRSCIMLYMTRCGTARGVQWHLIHIHSMKYAKLLPLVVRPTELKQTIVAGMQAQLYQ